MREESRAGEKGKDGDGEELCCRICMHGPEEGRFLEAQCACKGELSRLHDHCLKQWLIMQVSRRTTAAVSRIRKTTPCIVPSFSHSAAVKLRWGL